MLSTEQVRVSELYSYPNGMLNVGWLAGYVRLPDSKSGSLFLQQTNLVNQFLPVRLRSGDTIPPDFPEYSRVRLICQVGGEQLRDGTYVATMTAQKFDFANVLDMPLDAAFKQVPPPGAPADEFRPFSGREDRLSDTSNVVRVAGFIYGTKFRPAGNNKRARCDVLLRQTEDVSKCIPLRFYGHLAEAVYRRVEPFVGLPCIAVGRYVVDAKTIGDAPEDGAPAPVARFPYIECAQPIGPANIGQRGNIRFTPAWAQQVIEDLMAKREAKKAARVQAAQSAPAGAGVEIATAEPASSPDGQVIDKL